MKKWLIVLLTICPFGCFSQQKDTIINSVLFDSLSSVITDYFNEFTGFDYSTGFQSGIIDGVDVKFDFPYNDKNPRELVRGIYCFRNGINPPQSRKRFYFFVYGDYTKILGNNTADNLIREALDYSLFFNLSEIKKCDLLKELIKTIEFSSTPPDPSPYGIMID